MGGGSLLDREHYRLVLEVSKGAAKPFPCEERFWTDMAEKLKLSCIS